MEDSAVGPAPALSAAVEVTPGLAGLEPARQAVLAALAGQPPGELARYRLELVLEELLSNIVRHGAARRLTVRVGRETGRVWLRVEDDGPPFDPTGWQGNTTPPRDAPEASTGGRGILLVRRYAQRLDYRREAGHNRVDVAIADA